MKKILKCILILSNLVVFKNSYSGQFFDARIEEQLNHLGYYFSKRVPGRSCQLFSSENQQGFRVYLKDGESLNNFHSFMMERRTWNGYIGRWFGNPWSGQDRNFNAEASSVYVGQGCLLTVYSDHDYHGEYLYLYGETDLNLEKVNFNNRIRSVVCNCSNSGKNKLNYSQGKPQNENSGNSGWHFPNEMRIH